MTSKENKLSHRQISRRFRLITTAILLVSFLIGANLPVVYADTQVDPFAPVKMSQTNGADLSDPNLQACTSVTTTSLTSQTTPSGMDVPSFGFTVLNAQLPENRPNAADQGRVYVTQLQATSDQEITYEITQNGGPGGSDYVITGTNSDELYYTGEPQDFETDPSPHTIGVAACTQAGQANLTIRIALSDRPDPPEITASLPAVALSISSPGNAGQIDLTRYFTDPDAGDTLTYSATSQNEAVVTATVNAAQLSLAAQALGTATVSVTATDEGGRSVTGSMSVTVSNPPVIDTNHSAYFAEDPGFRFELAENTDGRSTPVQLTTDPITASDPDPGDSVELSLLPVSARTIFNLNSSGHLFYIGEVLDYEAFIRQRIEPAYYFSVAATDSAGITVTARIKVTVTNQYEDPVALVRSGRALGRPGESATGNDGVFMSQLFTDHANPQLRFAVEVEDPSIATPVLAAAPNNNLALNWSYDEIGYTTISVCATTRWSPPPPTSGDTQPTNDRIISSYAECEAAASFATFALSVAVVPAGSAYQYCPFIYYDDWVEFIQAENPGTPNPNEFELGMAEPRHLLCLTYQLIDRLFYPESEATDTEIAEWAMTSLERAKAPTGSPPTSPLTDDDGTHQYECLLPAAAFLPLCQALDELAPDSIPPAIQSIVRGIIAGLGDQYTSYADQEATDRFLTAIGLGQAGVGIEFGLYQPINPTTISRCPQVSETCAVYILEVYPDHPAAQATNPPRRFDIILEVDGVAIPNGSTLADVSSLLYGDEDSQVRLKFQRPAQTGAALEWELTLTRVIEDEPVVDSQRFGVYPDSQTPLTWVGYIALERFTHGADEQFRTALEDLLNQGVEGLLIDLRGNPGGLVQSARNIIHEFLEPGQNIATIEVRGENGAYVVPSDFMGLATDPQQLPVAFLVNGGSYSAAETFAASLQRHQRALVLGEKSGGKSTTQNIYLLSPLGSIRLTRSELTFGGTSIHEVGITPEVTFEDPCVVRFSGFTQPTNCGPNQVQSILRLAWPTVTGFTVSSEVIERGYYRLGDQLQLGLSVLPDFGDLIYDTSDGSPTLSVTIGDTPEQLPLLPSSTGSPWFFGKTITTADTDPDGPVIADSGLELNGAVVRRASGWPMLPYHPEVPIPFEIYTNPDPSYQATNSIDIPENTDGTTNPVELLSVRPRHQADRPITSYRLEGGEVNLFSVSGTGLLSYVGPGRDFESNPPTHSLEVVATDSTGFEARGQLEIRFTDVDEPVTLGTAFSPISLQLGSSTQTTVDLNPGFVDPENTLTFRAVSSDPTRVEVSSVDTAGILTVTGIAPTGNQPVTVTVYASDRPDTEISQNFSVEVLPASTGSAPVVNPVSPSGPTGQQPNPTQQPPLTQNLPPTLEPLPTTVQDFVDDDGNTHEQNIEQLAVMGITQGCNPPENTEFCPRRAVTRGEMATFLVRGLGLNPSDDDLFTDDQGSTHERNINRLGSAGITQGCNPPINDRFCPDLPVTRGQMATFLARALSLPAGSGAADFSDTDGSVHSVDIDRIFSVGITQGCNPPVNDRFCPERPVTRAEMATFLVRALALES